MQKIDADLRRAVQNTTLRERFAAQALETREAGPDALATIMREDLARWTEVIQRLGVRQD